jgi:hypothetical protein
VSDTTFILGFLASTLLPALLVAWLIRRWARGLARLLIAVVLIGGVAWLGMGVFVSQALSGFSVPMD